MTENSSANLPTSDDESPNDSELLRQQLRGVTDVRLDKIEEICRSMASGEYEVDSSTLAERILAKMSDSPA